MKSGQLVKSKLSQHSQLTTWRILEIEKGISGKVRYFCEASHDTKTTYGFDKIKHEFKAEEIELIK
tara:strand:+ start:131 stop:328 length:198 start_codon:yes stop_codon:yes gene_type:complete